MRKNSIDVITTGLIEQYLMTYNSEADKHLVFQLPGDVLAESSVTKQL